MAAKTLFSTTEIKFYAKKVKCKNRQCVYDMQKYFYFKIYCKDIWKWREREVMEWIVSASEMHVKYV